MTNLLQSNMFVYITDKLEASITLDSPAILHNCINPANAYCDGPPTALYVYTLITDHDFDYNCLIDISDPGYMKMVTNEPVTVEPKYKMERGVGGIYAIKPFKERVTVQGLYFDKLTKHVDSVFGNFRGYIGLELQSYAGATGARITFKEGYNDLQLEDDQEASLKLVETLQKYVHKGSAVEPYYHGDTLAITIGTDRIESQIALS